jgi:hypothetical protein
MKIEIGESLIRLWLRHIKHCEFAELNWKPSHAWEAMVYETVASLFNEPKAYLKRNYCVLIL